MSSYRDPTSDEQAAIDRLTAEMATIIGIYGLHPKVKAALATAGYITTDMFSGCYTKESDIPTEAAAEFGFAENDIATEEDIAKGITEVKFTKQTSKT